jgi:hypothetical protein
MRVLKIVALACVFAGALAVEYVLLARHFRRQALAESGYTAAFYCDLALNMVADAERQLGPDTPRPPVFDYVTPVLQGALRKGVVVYADYVGDSPGRHHLQNVNLLGKVLQGYLGAEGERSPETEEAVLALKAALREWSEAHPQEARHLRYRTE